MVTSVVTAAGNEGYVESTSGSYASMLSGSGLSAHTGDPLAFTGQSFASGVFFGWQSFWQFGWTADSDSVPVSAYVRLRNNQSAGSGTARDFEVRGFDFGATVGTSDWRTPAQLNSATLRGRVAGVNQVGGQVMRAGLGGASLAQVDSSATLRYVACTSRHRTQQTPSGLEWNTVRTTNHTSGPDPVLYVAGRTKSLLDLSLGGQVQLSDGTHMLLSVDEPAGGDTAVSLVHHDGTAPTVVVPGGAASGRRGAQAYAMCRDDADNVYVVNRASPHNVLNCRAFIKGSGSTWAAGAIRAAAMPTYDGHINNVSVAWHPQGGTRGTIVAVVGHEAATNTGTELAFALINVDHLHTGSGSVLRGSGSADGVLVDSSAPSGFNNYLNESSTLLDVCAVRDANGDVSGRGFVTSTSRHQVLGARNSQSVGTYVLNGSGSGFASSARRLDSTSGYSVKDPDGKSRVVPVGPSQFVTVNASSSADFGITVKHRQFSAGEFSVLSDVRLDAQGITSMPSPSELATSSAWDAVYDPATGLVAVYYFDAADDRRLMKTHVNLTTGLAAADEVEVADEVGAAGSTNHAVRVHRGEMTGQQVLISVANETSGGDHELLLVVDDINLPPDAPLLTTKANFDADDAALFEWEFRDPNPSDTQSAFQLEIWDDTTNTLVHDTTKTVTGDDSYELAAETLDNGESYRWRVKTWDSADEDGPFSSFSFFATSASGNVTITFPASDNEPLEAADVQIVWGVTGATQDEYRVVVVRTSDEVVHSDTGWVESTDTTFLVTGLASETEYRVEVTIRDNMVESSTGTRLVTPDYTSPVAPVVTVTPVPEGAHIRVSVDNPEPGELVSTLDGGFEDGVDGWTTGAPQLVGHHSARNFGADVTVNVPTGTSDGDLMMLAVTSNFDNDFTPDAAWGSPVEAETVDGHGLTLYQRIADSEPASYTTTWSNPSNWHSVAIVVLRGVDGLGAFDFATVSSATSLDHPQISVGVDDWALLIGHTAESGPRTLPGTVTVLESQEHGVIVGYEPQPAAGTSGPWTLSYVGNPNGMITFSQALTTSASVQQSDDQADTGTHSALITAAGTPAVAGIRPEAGHRAEVDPFARYTVQAMAYSTASATVRASIDWYDTNGDLISTTSSDTAVGAAEWTRVEHTASAPAGATHAGYGPDLVGPSNGETVYVDEVALRTATDVPVPSENQLWRSEGDNPPILIATVDPGSSYRDYLAGAGRVYTYMARAIAADGATADSAPVDGSVYFLGVWIHDPADPEGTIEQYMFGRSQRNDNTSVEQASHHFVGRENPVTYFGQNKTHVWDVTVDIPEGPDRLPVTDTLRDWEEARRTLVARDNRGRVFVSTMGDLPVDDQDWGDQVSFTLTRVSSDLPGGER